MSLLHDLAHQTAPSKYIEAVGASPLDPWQREAADADCRQKIMLCSRQVGKTRTTAGIVGQVACTEPGALVLVLGPSERQSQELLRKTHEFIDYSVVRVTSSAAKSMELSNGSRIYALPGNERTIRGFSAPRLLIVDEAAMAPDSIYHAIRPMMATNPNSQIILLSTPKGRRGFFYDEWHNGGDDWYRVKTTVYDCPRISPEWIAREKSRIPEWLFAQEYLCEFVDNELAVFAGDLVDAAFIRGRPLSAANLGETIPIPMVGEALRL